MLWYLLLSRCWSKLTLCCMALIAVCLSVTFVICGRANEGSGGPESKVKEGGRDGLAGEGGSNRESEGGREGRCVCSSLVCQLQICWCGSRSFPSVTLLIYLIYLNHLPLPPINTGDLDPCVCVCQCVCMHVNNHIFVCVCVCAWWNKNTAAPLSIPRGQIRGGKTHFPANSLSAKLGGVINYHRR